MKRSHILEERRKLVNPEEVLCNAVFHKSWDDRNPIEVRINPNDIEVFNIEGPMPPLTQKDIQQERVASRNYRNRRIGDFLKELRLTEGRSTGFPKIRQALRRNGSPEVVFETDERNSYFLAHIDIHPAFKGADVHQDGPQDVHQDVSQGDTQGDTQEIILDKWIEGQIRNNPAITTEELAKLSRKGVATIKRHISKLPHLKYVGSGYSGHWEVYDDVKL